jgi:hypothetical protein
MKVSLFILLLFVGSSAYGSENIETLKALLRISESKIPQNGLHCEINGTNSLGLYNDITVGDVLADFIDFTLLKSSAKKHSFKCDGKGVLDCILKYGEKENLKNPGWDIILKFQYNEKNGLVVPGSLKCIQVP